MTDDELIRMLQSAVPPTAGRAPSSDLWPAVAARVRTAEPPSGFDIGVAVVVVVLLALFPAAAWFIAYHM